VWLQNKLSKVTKSWRGKVVYKCDKQLFIFNVATQQKFILVHIEDKLDFFLTIFLQLQNGNFIAGDKKVLYEFSISGRSINQIPLTYYATDVLELHNGDILVREPYMFKLLDRRTFTFTKSISCDRMPICCLGDKIVTLKGGIYALFDSDLNIVRELSKDDIPTLFPVFNYVPPCFNKINPPNTILIGKDMKEVYVKNTLTIVKLLDDGRSIDIFGNSNHDTYHVEISNKNGVQYRLPAKQELSTVMQLDHSTIVYETMDNKLVVCDIDRGIVKETYQGAKGEVLCFLLE
jgi:hypothetical protein